MKSFFVILLFSIFSVKCYADTIGSVVDTVKYIFILDGKVVSSRYIGEHLKEIEWVTTATTAREAVFATAGEYRTPFYMFRTRKEEGGNE